MIEQVLYNRSPVLFQNVMTTIYGLKLHWERYGGENKTYTGQLAESEFETATFFSELQARELRSLVHHTYHTTLHYRKLFDEIGIQPSDIDSPSDLKKIPILEKSEITANPGLFLSSAFKFKALSKIYTSGTTGSPLTVFYDKTSRRKNYAFFNRVRRWRGTRVGNKRATFYGRTIIPLKQKAPPFWRYDLAEKNMLFSSYHMSPDSLPHYYDKLCEFQPVEIRGYPSSLYSLALYMTENRLSGIRPKAIFTTAETLFQSTRDIIEDAFQCEITDTYGCTEMAFYITQCEYGTYHAHPEYGIIETLDSDGNSVSCGPGELVCTGFVNYAMPLLRYRVGDTLAIDHDDCPCGRQFPVVGEILGRTDDIIITPEGRPVGRLDPVFKGGLGVEEAQIVQTKKDEILLRLVKNDRYSVKDQDFLTLELRKRVGHSMAIAFEFIPKIERDKNGKFRAVISLLGSNRRPIP